jgi:glycosyltransferase involved in cell wall biosynthesis
MRNPLISLIIPTFNAASQIYQCIESIRRQLDDDLYEIIVIDGGSTDATISIIKEHDLYKKKLEYYSESDEGIYDAMNKGVKKASGKFCLFLGADDRLFLASKDIRENIIQQDVIYYGNVILSNNNTIYDGPFTTKKLIMENICHQSILYPKKLLYENPYDLKYKYLSDWANNIKLWNIAKWVYIPIVFSIYSNTGSSTVHKDIKFKRDMLCVINKNLGFYFFCLKLWKTIALKCMSCLKLLNNKHKNHL